MTAGARFIRGAAAAILGASLLGAQEPAPISSQLVGSRVTYAARAGDSLTAIGARFGVSVPALARENGLQPAARLKLGQALQVDNRHIVPVTRDDGIVINVPQRMLYHFARGSLVGHYPTGLGRPTWRTPTGTFHVRTKQENPVWHVPRSIQEEMRRTDQEVKTLVPPGPDNPLGQYWLGLSRFDCGIHGTNAPTSVYQFRTHGCIRLHPEDIAELYPQVAVGTMVEIIYEPVLMARTAEGTISSPSAAWPPPSTRLGWGVTRLPVSSTWTSGGSDTGDASARAAPIPFTQGGTRPRPSSKSPRPPLCQRGAEGGFP